MKLDRRTLFFTMLEKTGTFFRTVEETVRSYVKDQGTVSLFAKPEERRQWVELRV